ncbi:MAG: hypothetical protein IJP69_08375 [Synergistaceae bacterium]|nr:hypothetical protein [Synergistaceae bacterium]MBR0080370.1 hypothetical protein [Synergistaceae bacterium]MBR0253230.1 hypothetical protein [Synergistaceae bacterium]
MTISTLPKTSAQKSVKVIINEIPNNPSKPSDEKEENEKDKDIINPDIPDSKNKSDDKKPYEQKPNNSPSKDNEIFYSVSMDLSKSESSDIDLSTLPEDVESVDISDSEKLKTLSLLFSSCKVNENTFIYDGCENLKILAFNKNRFSQFDYDENELPSLEEFSCDSQKIDKIWKPSQNFNTGFEDDFSGNYYMTETKGKIISFLLP